MTTLNLVWNFTTKVWKFKWWKFIFVLWTSLFLYKNCECNKVLLRLTQPCMLQSGTDNVPVIPPHQEIQQSLLHAEDVSKLQRHYTDFSRRQAAFDTPYSESTLEVIWSASNIPQIDKNKFTLMCLSVILVTCDPLNMSLPETLILLQFCLTQYSSYLTGRRSNNWNQWRKHKGHDTCQSNRANQVWWQKSATVVETWNRPGPRIWWVFIFTFFYVHDSI